MWFHSRYISFDAFSYVRCTAILCQDDWNILPVDASVAEDNSVGFFASRGNRLDCKEREAAQTLRCPGEANSIAGCACPHGVWPDSLVGTSGGAGASFT